VHESKACCSTVDKMCTSSNQTVMSNMLSGLKSGECTLELKGIESKWCA